MDTARQQAREMFRKMRFGMFIHWGIYSLLERGEWVMYHEKIPVQEYEKLMHQFNPVLYNPREWIALAKRAGMRYITITTKHHDGFCMYDSALTDYKITNTPFRRDVIGELVRECRRQRVAILFYYSPLDWHHPAYNSDWEAYTRYWHGQVLELVRKYKPMGIWLDGCWHKPENLDATWRLSELYRELRRIAPGILIGNNHHQPPLPDEDIQTFEQDLPGENTAGFNKAMPVEGALYETCMTINNSWGYNAPDQNHKSSERLIRLLAECAGRDANFLLNVGPKSDGTIQPEHVERLEAIGRWLRKNGKAIYGTRGQVFTSTPWGTATRTAKSIYLHIWNPPETSHLTLQMPATQVKRARLLATGEVIKIQRQDDQVLVPVPKPLPDPANTVIQMEVS
ncbi:MAG: alpha-L-fucosidase [Armatimonadota bacterium]